MPRGNLWERAQPVHIVDTGSPHDSLSGAQEGIALSLASKTIDQGAIVAGIFSPGSIEDKVTDAYRKHLFGNATLHDLPAETPRFGINPTNVQSGVLFRRSRPFIADYRPSGSADPNTATTANKWGLLPWTRTAGDGTGKDAPQR